MAYVNGKFVMAERNLEQSQLIVSFLAEIRDLLKSPAVKLVGLLPDALNTDQRAILSEKCGLVAISPILVAAEKGAVCYSDDAIIRAIARLESRTPGFSTQALLRLAHGKGAISQTEYEEAIITLIESNYSFVSEDVGTLWRAYERGNGRFNPLASTIINRISDPNYNASSCMPLLAEFSARVWTCKGPEGANSREDWIGDIWRAIVKCENHHLLLEFLGKLAVACSRFPGVFAGIVNFGIMHVDELRPQRSLLFITALETMETMQRLTLEFYPQLPGLSDDWRLQARIALLLQRQGLIGVV